MSSGEIAADVVSKALETEDLTETFLSNYQINWKKDFGEDLEILSRFLKEKHINSTKKYFQIAFKDKKLTELLIRILTGQISIKENQWKIAKRFIYGPIKSPFSEI